jgi:hypothetical protein
MLYRGSGSDFGKVTVPDPDNIKHSLATANNVIKILALMLQAALFLKKVVHFKLDPGSKSGFRNQNTFRFRVPLRQKVAVPAVPVPQHWREVS